MNNLIITWSPGHTLDSLEKQVIEAAWTYYRKNKSLTASSLGITVRTLENKLKQYEQEDADARERNEFDKRRRNILERRSLGKTVTDAELASIGLDRLGRPLNRSDAEKIIAAEDQATRDRDEAAAGNGVESSSRLPTQPRLPVQERSEIQSMSFSDSAKGNSRRTR